MATDSVLIATTQQRGLHPLGTAGQTVIGAYDQIARFLAGRLSPAHAALFAEPNRDPGRGTVDWYAAAAGGPVRRLVDADAETRAAAAAVLGGLVADIRREAAALGRSTAGGDRFLGELLGLALEVPGDASVYLVGEQPVLVCWGHLQDRPAAARGVLARLVPLAAPAPPPHRPPPTPSPADAAPAASGSPVPGTAAVVAVAPGVAAEGYGWLTGLLWLLFGLLVAAILFVLLSACGVAPRWFGDRAFLNFCPIPAVIADDRADRDSLERERRRAAILEDELHRLNLALVETAVDCRRRSQVRPAVPTEEGTGAPAPAATEDPEDRPEAVPETPPDEPVPDEPVRDESPDRDPPDAEPADPDRADAEDPDPTPPAPRPATAEDDREFDQRLEREGGEQGRATVTLSWDSDADLDLSIICPDGSVISFSQLAGCGGRLDVDMNAGGGEMSDTPVENVVFGDDSPPGRYQVRVDNYDGRSDEPNSTVFRLRIINGDQRDIIEGEIAEADGPVVQHEFVIP